MNLSRSLMLPWRYSPRRMRWFGGGLALAMTVFSMAIPLLARQPNWVMLSVYVYAVGQAFLWAFVIASTVLLHMDAHALRVPGPLREIMGAIALYLVLSVLPATFVLGVVSGQFLTIGVMLTFSCLCGMAFVLLPRYIALWVALIPAFNNALSHLAVWPAVGSTRFFIWMLGAILVLVAVLITRWYQLLYKRAGMKRGLSGPVIQQFRTLGRWDSMVLSCPDGPYSIRNRPDWMMSRVDIRKAGPDQPIRALRVALGGWSLPRTLGGHLRNLAPLIILLILLPGIALLVQIGTGAGSNFLRGVALGSIGWFGVAGIGLLSTYSRSNIRKRWSMPNGELSLLALLPGMGDRRRVQHHVLCVTLLAPARIMIVLMALLLGMAWYMHIPAIGMLLIGLSVVGCALLLFALMLNVIGGKPFTGPVQVALILFVDLMTSVSCLVPLVLDSNLSWAYARLAQEVLLLLWVPVIIMLVQLIRRGRRDYGARAHPFLMLDTAGQ